MAPEVPIDGECEARFQPVRRAFAANFETAGEVGAAVAVTLDGRLVVDLWGGHMDKERARRWDRDTLVNVYSSTKGITAICAHRLVDQGKLDLDAPVAKYWPEFAQAGKQNLPMRWLLSHRAGLPAVSAALEPDAIFDWERMTSLLAAQTPWWEPGTQPSPDVSDSMVARVWPFAAARRARTESARAPATRRGVQVSLAGVGRIFPEKTFRWLRNRLRALRTCC